MPETLPLLAKRQLVWEWQKYCQVRSRTADLKIQPFIKNIAPHLCGLSWVVGRVPTPHGVIALKVNKTSGGESLVLTLPAAVRATVVIPGTKAMVNGKAVKVSRLSGKRRSFVLHTPGHYRVVCSGS